MGIRKANLGSESIKLHWRRHIRLGCVSRCINTADNVASRMDQRRWAGGRIKISGTIQGQRRWAGNRTCKARDSIGGKTRKDVNTARRCRQSSIKKSPCIIASQEKKKDQEVRWSTVRSILG